MRPDPTVGPVRFGLSLPNVGSPTELVAAGPHRRGHRLGRRVPLGPPPPRPRPAPRRRRPVGACSAPSPRSRPTGSGSARSSRRWPAGGPWKVAKEVVTLDHLSGGRAVVGVGLGEPPDDDFAAFGDPADARERAALLDDGLAVLAGLLTGEPFTHDGPRYRVDAEFLPAPVQQPRPPIWVAGVLPHRRPFERARRWDGVMPLAARGADDARRRGRGASPSPGSARASTSSCRPTGEHHAGRVRRRRRHVARLRRRRRGSTGWQGDARSSWLADGARSGVHAASALSSAVLVSGPTAARTRAPAEHPLDHPAHGVVVDRLPPGQLIGHRADRARSWPAARRGGPCGCDGSSRPSR